jgi:hypothetical protein
MVAPTAWRRALLGVACLIAACTPSAAPSSSVRSTASPVAEAGNLPAGCEPIHLRSPAGEAVDLTGIWIQDEDEDRLASTWWIRALGDCVWGSGISDNYSEDPRPDSVQVLQGRVGNDFVIDGTIVLVGPPPFFVVPQFFAEVRLLIEFAPEGEITLREDRIPGIQGPRCPDAVGYCPAPLVLRPSS